MAAAMTGGMVAMRGAPLRASTRAVARPGAARSPRLAASAGLSPLQLQSRRWVQPSWGGPGSIRKPPTRFAQTQQRHVAVRASSVDTEVEVQGLTELAEKLADTKATEGDMRWFLRDRKFDVDAADTKIRKMLAWREDFGADDLTEEYLAPEAATGKAYLHSSRDKFGRPVIVVTAIKHLAGDADSLKRVCELATFLLDTAVNQLKEQDVGPWDSDAKGKPIPKVEQTVLCIFDLHGFTNKNGDLGFAKFMVDVFFNLYPKRLSECLFLDAPLVFRPGWAIIKPWLGSYSKLVRFAKADEIAKDYFTPETCPESLEKK